MTRKSSILKLLIVVATVGLILTGIGGVWAGMTDVYVDYQPAFPSPSITHVYIVSVGNNKYIYDSKTPAQNSGYDLMYAEVDASALASKFADHWKQAGYQVTAVSLLNSAATPPQLTSALEGIAQKANPDDLLILCFAGRSMIRSGLDGNSNLYFGLYNAPEDGAVDPAWFSASSLRQATKNIQCSHELFVLDTCNEGDSLRTFLDRTQDASENARKLDGVNISVIAAGGIAYENSSIQHGDLTYAILKGIDGQARLVTSWSNITAQELTAYVTQSVFATSEGTEHCQSYFQNGDFTIIPPQPDAEAQIAPTRDIAPADQDSTTPQAPSFTKGTDYALIVATDKYDNYGTLANPIDDATAVEQELTTHYGFQCQLLQNPSRDDIFKAILAYKDKTYQPGDQLLVYFAGHGVDDWNDGYLLAQDTKSLAQDPYYDTFIEYSALRQRLLRLPCPHILLALDVCYGGSFLDQSSLVPSSFLDAHSLFQLTDDDANVSPIYAPVPTDEQLGRLMQDRTREAISSVGDSPAPDGDPGQHSPFAKLLLDRLKQGESQSFTTAHGLYEYIVQQQSQPELDVFDNSKPKGDFVFVPKR